MGLAFKKYQTGMQKKVWKAKARKEQEIVNLSAQLKKSDATKPLKKPFSKGGDGKFKSYPDKCKKCYE
jgi:hypothetical protein